MPAGDPAGYLPNVIKKRLKKTGATPYRPRGKRGGILTKPRLPQRPKADPATGGVQAPEKPTPMPPKRPGGSYTKPAKKPKARAYFGRTR